MLLAKANKVNELLEAQGKKVVQEIIIGNKPARYGFKPQYVIDAVNEIFGPDNWHYQLHNTELFTTDENNNSGQVVVSVELFLRTSPDSDFFSRGIQFGQSQIVYGNVGDAKKGAVTDAIQKNLSLFSIGKAAYRGELEAVFKANRPELTRVPTKQKVDAPPSAPKNQSENTGLPELPNVSYETSTDGTVMAKGDTYNNRTLLKSMGFVWLPKEKGWGLRKAA
ncbi:MAG: RAD52 family DNA repair protein [Proteobacteria bacterium]|nr:RAD52 family DNA repair protein [Pseudomonadota bacterium]